MSPLLVEKVSKGKEEILYLNDGSILKLKTQNTGEYINIKKSLLEPGRLALDIVNAEKATDDYVNRFAIIKSNIDEHLRFVNFADLLRFIRLYDEETIRKNYDYTEKYAIQLLSQVLKKLKKICLNSLPSACQISSPSNLPNSETQRVKIKSIKL